MGSLSNVSMHRPCADWVQKLAARHSEDLSPSDRRALHEHLALCEACNAIYMMYRVLDAKMSRSIMKRPIPEFSYEPCQPLKKPSTHTLTRSLHTLPLLFLATLTSFSLKISWSPFFQAIHARVVVALSKFPSRMIYASAGNRFLYVMRSDSGYFLWKQKKSRRNELVAHLPVRSNAMLFTGSGTALAAALDFCKHAVQA